MRNIFIASILLWSICLSITAVPADPKWIQELQEQGDTGTVSEIRRSEVRLRSRRPSPIPSVQKIAGRSNVAEATNATNLAPRGLLILANFLDVKFNANNTVAEMDSMLNGCNYTYGNAYGSARKYFIDQSNGSYQPEFDVVGPILLPNNMAYYGGNGSAGRGGDLRLGDVVLHACSIASQIQGVDFSNYDNNRDGILDFVYIVYAGYNEAEGGAADCLWPCSWDMPSTIESGLTSLSKSAKPSSYTFSSKRIHAFAMSSELRGSRGTNRAGIGTFCHEFSHVLGLPDYYDTEYGDNETEGRTPGNWSLMCNGSYCVNGEVPPNYSAHDKWMLGWATPTLLYTPENVTLPADQQTYRYINATGKVSSPTSATVQYYLENRQQTGWDKGLPGHGMVVWYVKYDAESWNDNIPNNTYAKPLFTVTSATGSMTNIGTAADPFPGSRKVTTFTPFSNYPLTEITEQNGVITFKFMGGKITPPPGPDVPEDYIDCDAYSWTAEHAMAAGENLLGDYTWTVDSKGNTFGFEATNSARGCSFGTANSPTTIVNLSTHETDSCLISSITIQAATANRGNAILDVSIAGESIGQQQLATSGIAEYTFTNTEEKRGQLQITLSNNAEKAMYLKSIKIAFVAKTPTGIQHTAKPAYRKQVINGQIVIQRDGKSYNILGNIIK